jgi:hypothetical protein
MLKAGVGSWSLLLWNGETETQVGRVDWLVTEHLSAQIQGEDSVISDVQIKLEPLLLAHLTHQQSLKMDYKWESYSPPK